jgi:uncharacterized protein with GYD domain
MSTYLVLSKFTEQGIRDIKDTTKRAEAFKKAAANSGLTVKEILWTQGQYDLVTVIEAPNEIAAAALGLSVAKLGNIRSETLRAFTQSEMERILDKVA